MRAFPILLTAALLLAACAPAVTAQPSALPELAATAEPGLAPPTESAQATQPPADTEAQPQPAPTSRGDQLEASDPASVVLGNGQPALVEFFRFT
jgi:hypothetical protein